MSFWDWLWGAPETHVASSSYNLAGDQAGKVKYLQLLTVQSLFNKNSQGIGSDLTKGYLNGPGIDFRSFFRWADNNYTLGLPTGSLSATATVNMDVVAQYITHAEDETVWAQDGDTGIANYARWIEQWFLDNFPDQINTAWTADIDSNNVITITLANSAVYSFTPSNFNKNAKYIYAYYSLVKGEQPQPPVTGSTTVLAPGEPFPSTSGYTLIQTIEEARTTPLTVTTTELRTYSDGRPDEETVDVINSTGSYTYRMRHYRRTIYGGIANWFTGTIKEIRNLYLFEDKEVLTLTTTEETQETIPADPENPESVEVTVTVTTTTETKYLSERNSHRTDTQEVIINSWSPMKLFIYRIGSGIPALDASVQIIDNYGKFFPYLPIRIDNSFISGSTYTSVEKAYKKSVGGKLNELIDTLSANADIGDIDFTYILFGVSLNTKQKSELDYLYRFLQKLMLSQAGGPNMYSNWIIEREEAAATAAAWQNWYNAQSNSLDPLYGTPAPSVTVSNPTLTSNEIRIANTNCDVRINWFYITEAGGAGLGKPGAKKGDYWVQYMGTDEFASNIVQGNPDGYQGGAAIEKIRVYHQTSATSYIYLDAVGLVHRNFIYDGKYVQITASEALNDSRESGFILPLHYLTLKEMSLVNSTQLSLSCAHIVFNSYQVVKKEWWQTGFFQIIFVVGIAILSVFTFGVGGVGLLGANLALGGALGLTGLTAAIVGAVANALAAMILVSIITSIATGIFGEQIGSIIAVVASFLIIQGATSFHQSGSMALNWGELMKVDNLMMVMDAVGTGYTKFIEADIKQMAEDSIKLMEQADADLRRIQQEFYDQFGYGIGIIDPMTLTNNSRIILESGDTFLTRTLMTGSDIADMSMNMLTDFASLTLKLPNAYS